MVQNNNKIVENALLLAVKYHKRQKRKDGQPYIIHPIMVAIMLSKYSFKDEVIAGGICHDLLEDTKCREKEIVEVCGQKVLEIVRAVSDDKKYHKPHLWEKRKRIQIKKAKNAPNEAKAVYTADKIHNLQSLLTQYKKEGDKVWRHFDRGKDIKLAFEKRTLDMLKETWSHPLIKKYEKLIKEFATLK